MENSKNEENKKEVKKLSMKLQLKEKEISNGIRILMDLYILNNEIKNQIKNTNTLDTDQTLKKEECYLIKGDFLNFTKFFMYKNVYETIKGDKRDPKRNRASIFEKLLKNYKDIIFEKISNNEEIPSLKDESLYKIDFVLNSTKTEMIFLYQFIILNKAIVDNINKEIIKNDLFKYNYYINNKKIIIQYEPKNSILICFMNEADINNIIIPEIILEYEDKTQMLNQFNYFSKNEFSTFEKKIDLKNKINDIKDNNDKIIGKIYLIDINKYNSLNKYNENILLNLSNKEINNEEKYYIINNKYIQKLKELFENKNYIDENIIRNELLKEELLLLNRIEYHIDENNIIYYFNSIELITKELKNILEQYDLINQKNNIENIIQVEWFFIDNKIIIYSFSNNNNKNTALILNKNTEGEYFTELIFVFNDEEKLKNYLNIINKKGFDNIISEFNFKNKKSEIIIDKKDLYGYAYEIITVNKKINKKINEDILNIIKIYLSNKYLNEKIAKSKENNKNIFYEKCFLINKEFMEKYKEYFLYNDIEKYLDNNNNKENNIDIIYEDIIKKEEFYKKFLEKNEFDLNDINKEINKEEILIGQNKYYYINNFFIVNENIFKKILDKNEEYIIINSGIIFLFINLDNKNQVIIGEIKNDDNYLNINALIIFEDINEFNEFKNNLIKIDFSSYKEKFFMKKDNKLLNKEKKEIGIFVNINNNLDFFSGIEEEKEKQKEEKDVNEKELEEEKDGKEKQKDNQNENELNNENFDDKKNGEEKKLLKIELKNKVNEEDNQINNQKEINEGGENNIENKKEDKENKEGKKDNEVLNQNKNELNYKNIDDNKDGKENEIINVEQRTGENIINIKEKKDEEKKDENQIENNEDKKGENDEKEDKEGKKDNEVLNQNKNENEDKKEIIIKLEQKNEEQEENSQINNIKAMNKEKNEENHIIENNEDKKEEKEEKENNIIIKEEPNINEKIEQPKEDDKENNKNKDKENEINNSQNEIKIIEEKKDEINQNEENNNNNLIIINNKVEEEQKPKDEVQIQYNNFQFISEIYINFEKIKKQIKEYKLNEQENYYIINNDWFNYLNEIYNYNTIIEELNKNANFNKYVEDAIKNDEFIFNKDIINNIFKENNNIKIIDEIDISKDLEIEKNIQKIKEKIYLDKFLIINENIKEIFKAIFNISIDLENKFFMPIQCLNNENKKLIYIFYSLNNIYLINIGNFCEKDFTYETKLLLEVNNKEYFNEFVTKDNYINTELNKIIDNVLNNNNENNDIFKIEDENKIEKGICYLIQKNENKIQIIENYVKPDRNESISHFFGIDINALNQTKTLNNINIKSDKQDFPSEILEKDMKILIKYNLFQKEIEGAKKGSKILFKYFPNCYLTNIVMWYKYKSYFFNEKLNNIIEEETKNINKPINNKSKNSDEKLINNIYSKLIQNFDPKNKEQADSILKTLEDPSKFEILFENHSFNKISIKYPSNFEIVDEYTYNELIKRNDKKYDNNYLKCDIIINYDKIIIKYDIEINKQNQIYILLIGEIENNGCFNFETMIKFSVEKIRQNFFDNFKNSGYNYIMEKYKPFFLEYKVQAIKGIFIDYNNTVMNFEEKYLGNKMVKLFLLMYLFNEELEHILEKQIKNNGTKYYYLINKDWIKFYKEYYDYKKLCSYFDKNKSSPSYKDLVVYIKNNNQEKANKIIYQYTKNIPNDFLKTLEEKKVDQSDLIVKLSGMSSITKVPFKIGDRKVFDYLGENELIDDAIFDLLNQLETENITISIKNRYEKIKCLIGENKLFIYSQSEEKIEQNPASYFLNIGYIQKGIFTPSLLIYLYDRDEYYKIFGDLIENKFSNFIERYDKLLKKPSCEIENNGNNEQKKNLGKICLVSKLSEEIKNIIENANVINQDSLKILKLIIYLKKFEKEIKSPIKYNLEKQGYFVKMEFINEYQKFKSYNIIDKYITNNNDIKDIIENNLNKDIEGLFQSIKDKFDRKTIKLINNQKSEKIKKSTAYNTSLNKIILDKHNYITYADKCVLLNEEIYNLFKGWTLSENTSSNYLLGEDKIFLLNEFQKTILVYDIKNKYELNLQTILQYDNDKSSVLNPIIDNTYNKFINFLLFDNDILSPIFDQNQNKIGTAYKYPPSSKLSYIDDNICFDMRKIFLLYMNYTKLNNSLENNNNKFNDYYLVKKNWIQIYKNFFDFDNLYKEIDKISYVKDLIKNSKEDEGNKNIISDKKLTLMLKNTPKNLIKNFIDKEKYFEKKYKNSEYKTPNFLALKYNDELLQEKFLMYFEEFEIINSKIYEYLFKNINQDIKLQTKTKIFKQEMENDAEKVQCLIDKKRIIIKFMREQNSDKKYYISYIGYINKQFTYEIECFLLYDNQNLMNEHLLKIKSLNDFCDEFMKEQKNIKELILDNKKYGLAIKKIQNPDYDDNDLVTKYFDYAPRVGLANIGATCYMNATLQCFCQILEFASFFKYNKHVRNVSNKYQQNSLKCLTSSFKILIEQIWPQNAMKVKSLKRFFEPKEFRQKIADMSPLFVNNQANDAKDLVNFIIMTLHEELNIPNENNNINLMIQNQQDENEVFNVFFQDYNNNFRSKISELFYAIQKTGTTCKLCNRTQYNFQAYFFLVFPLEEVKKYIINKINTPQNMNNINNPLINNNNMMMNNFQGMNMNMINNGFNFMNNMNNFNMNNINCMNGMNNNICNMFNNNSNFNNNMNCMGMNNYNMNNGMIINPMIQQMNNQINPQMNHQQINNQMNNQINQQMNQQINNQMNQQMNNQINNQINNQMNHQMNHQMNNQINPQMNQQINQQMNNQMNQQMNQQINNQINNQMNNQINNQMNHQMNHQMNNQINPQMNQQINQQMNQQINPQMNQQINQQMNQHFNPQTNSHLNRQMSQQMKPSTNIPMNRPQINRQMSLNPQINLQMNQINQINQQMNPQMNQINQMPMMNQLNPMMNYGMMPQNMFNYNMNNMNNIGVTNIIQNININNNNGLNQNINIQKLQKLNNNIVEILDCFEYNQKVDLFTGKDKIYCNNCGNMAEAYYQSILKTAPKILILLLNRGVGIQFKIKLEFTTILDLTNYITKKNGNKNIKYKLIGVITHLGESGASGHFIAHCLSPIDYKWYTYNDAIVNEIDNFQKNIIDLGMPYLLFYRLIDENEVQNNNNIVNIKK